MMTGHLKPFLLTASTLLLLYSSFTFRSSPAQTISKDLQHDFKEFKKHYTELKSLILSLDTTSSSAESTRKKFLEVRLAYKKIEFLTDYISPQFIKDYINGPPLPRLARNVYGVQELEPVSLQKLEELLFEEKPSLLKKEILNQYNEIEGQMTGFNFIVFKPLTDRQIFESLRFGILRIFALGLTGFDNPASGNTMQEVLVSFTSMQTTFEQYTKSYGNPVLRQRIRLEFSQGAAYLQKHQDFDNFDRAVFFRNFLQPLYKDLLEYHIATGIETITDVSSVKQPLNYFEPSVFSENLLNRYFFSGLNDKKDHNKAVKLGKILFFDPLLSSNNERSCASCHQPEKAFTDGKNKSVALDFKGTVDRNAPTLIDAAYSARQFWDMRASRLEQQAEHVIVSAKEFHTDYYSILGKLGRSMEYQVLFKEAFGGKEPVNKDNFSAALAAYVSSLTSFNSEFDQYMRKEKNEIAPEVLRGFNLFMGKAACGTCHFAPVFNGLVPPFYDDSEAEVLGVPASNDTSKMVLDEDPGRAWGQFKERSPIFNNAFKTPTVRNVALTAPYMHNGVFTTLEEVMRFYNKGGGKGQGLDVPTQTLPEDPLNLSQKEISDIIAFMKSLTDTSGLTGKPAVLPRFEENSVYNNRKVSGTY